MPDIAATRPTSGAPVESAWGGQVHDAVEGLQAGTSPIALANASTGTVAVTFPRAYASPPVVVATVNFASAGYFAIAHTVTATGFSLQISHRDGTNSTATIPASWVAVGTPA